MAGYFQIPYRELREGFWGEQTSTLNWCEEVSAPLCTVMHPCSWMRQDYSITYYCAELVNTLTNLIFVYLGVKGIRNCLLYCPKPSIILAYLGYLTVSMGSMAFHATLKCTQDPSSSVLQLPLMLTLL